MEISAIASGSNGNCCLVEDKNTSVLIDAGKSAKEIGFRMDHLGKSLENIDAVILTHAHIDHYRSVGVLSRRFGLPVYMTKKVHNDISFSLGKIKAKYFSLNSPFKIKNLKFEPVLTSHDVQSCGFRIGKFGLFTDTGIVTKEMETAMKGLKMILLESNHDIDLLLNGPYPAFLKQRIFSDKGHLSNIHAGLFVDKFGVDLELALLGHLSANNNSIKLVEKTFETLVKRKINYHVLDRNNACGSWAI